MRLVLLPSGVDLLEGLLAVAAGEGTTTGWVQGIGALDGASLAWYDQEAQTYRESRHEGGLEILSLAGNLSRREGEVFPHIHLLLSRRDGSTVGGHALPGCKVFACELALWPHPEIQRFREEKTGLWLWPRPGA